MPDFIVIDHLEDDLARVEWGERLLDLPRAWLPKDANEGDHLRVHAPGDGLVSFKIDRTATKRAQSKNQQALDTLNAQDDGGDLDL
ncbi:DUF3006 domain-containing protein [Deinococcus pimensis]|uniref:DUF3006 domain-containing protein n=1 Tax=Deinococcus pimensis TaxID=309888 RepID=UPI0004BC2D79|nr:DUF3006 domain-containing protein [Deinococcus pimensis]